MTTDTDRLQAQVTHLKACVLLYSEIAFRDGFRAGITFVPDHHATAGHLMAREWIDARRAEFDRLLDEVPEDDAGRGEEG